MIKIAFLLAVMTVNANGYAQNKVDIVKNLNYRQDVTPQGMDNHLFATYYYNGKKIYNLKSLGMASVSDKIQSIKVNPAGASYAVLSSNGKHWSLEIYDINNVNKLLHSFRKTVDARAMCYSADSKDLIVADGSGMLRYFDTRSYQANGEMLLGFIPSDMVTSSNGYFVAAVNDKEVVVVNKAAKTVRTHIKTGGNIDFVVFSADASSLGVLSDGTLNIYNTMDFNLEKTLDGLEGATSFTFHPDGKYVCVAQGGNRITLYNIFDKLDNATITEPRGSVSIVKYVNDAKHQQYLSYNTKMALCYKIIKGLKPNYARKMRDELNARMMEWCKRGEKESEAEYKERVNDETKKRQKRIFANEISTSLAGDIISHTTISLGRYNTASQTLELNLDGMSSIYLNVPQNDIPDFSDAGNLEFSDVQYGITKNDTFEVIYAKIRNKSTGKEYVFDNLEQQSLDFLATDDSFVPLELIQQAGREDIVLQHIKKDVVDKAKSEQLLSDHTSINVNTRIVSDVNANGERINNYYVDFDYSVEAQYSAKEDFAPGKYLIEHSHAAMSTLQIITKAFTSEFAQYIVPGKKVVVSITGSADAIPIVGTIPYNGCYGDFNNEPYWLDGNLSNITITRNGGIRTNEQLAFMRAKSVGEYLKEKMPAMSVMQIEPRYNISLSEGKGGEYRRIKVSFMFIDAMK